MVTLQGVEATVTHLSSYFTRYYTTNTAVQVRQNTRFRGGVPRSRHI